MRVEIGTPGMTIQLFVSDAAEGRAWYQRLFSRPPDFRPFGNDTFCEWTFKPGHWELHIVEQEPAGQQRNRLRFGVTNIDSAIKENTSRGIPVVDFEELPRTVLHGRIGQIDTQRLSTTSARSRVVSCRGGGFEP